MNNKVGLIILAAGKGTRMQEQQGNDLPKVLQPFSGVPLIQYLISGLRGAQVATPFIIVVGYAAQQVKDELGADYEYVMQAQQLGTGHALAQGESAFSKYDHVVVINGDMPFMDKEVVDAVVAKHLSEENVATMASCALDDFNDWRDAFKHHGRVVRSESNQVQSIVEYKDASEQQRAITEVNPSCFCFNTAWLSDHLDKLHSSNTQGEYYVVDLIAMAVSEGVGVGVVPIKAKACLGVNTISELNVLESMKDA